MQTLLALCFWRLALLCKLSHLPGEKGRVTLAGSRFPRSRRTEPNSEAESCSAFGSRQQQKCGRGTCEPPPLSSYSAHPCAAWNVKSCLQLFTWGCSRCSALNRSALCSAYVAPLRQDKLSASSVYWVHAAFLLKNVCKPPNWICARVHITRQADCR